MTGRELIIYILENGLEEVPTFTQEFFRGFPTIETVALAFNVGEATVETWIITEGLHTIEVDGHAYIYPDEAYRKFAEKRRQMEVNNGCKSIN